MIAAALTRRYPIMICDEHQDCTGDQHALGMAMLDQGARLRVFADPVQRIFKDTPLAGSNPAGRAMMAQTPLLSVANLRLEAGGAIPIVDDLCFEIGRGEFLGIVGESGSGKTMAARAIIGLLPDGVRHAVGCITLDGEDLVAVSPQRLRALRGRAIGMVFQEPMVSLNPAMTVGAQMAEAVTTHERLSGAELRRRLVAMLERVQIREPERARRSAA